jgi:hypothetical protein
LAEPAVQERRYVLTMDDLSNAVADYGINIKKPGYFADKQTAGTSRHLALVCSLFVFQPGFFL